MIHHGRMLMLWKIIKFMLEAFIFFHVPYLLVAFLPTLATFYLLLPSRLFCKVCIRDFFHIILIFLLFFHLCFLIFLLPSKVHMCDIEFYHHITFLLVI